MRGLILALGIAVIGASSSSADPSQISQDRCDSDCQIVSDLQTMGIPASVTIPGWPMSGWAEIYGHNPMRPTGFGLRLHEVLSRLSERERAQLQFRLARNDHAALAEALRVLRHVVEYDSNGVSQAYPEPVQAYMSMAEKVLKPAKAPGAQAKPEPTEPARGEKPSPASVREVLLKHREELESRRDALKQAEASAADILSRVLGQNSSLAGQFSKTTRAALQDLDEALDSIDALTGGSGGLTSRALLTLVRTLPEASLSEAQWKAVASAFPVGESINRMEIMKLWRQGLTGKGVRVGLVADGADEDHPNLRDVRVARNFTEERYADFPLAGLPDDRGSQGTHLAGIIRALAPDAEIRVYKAVENQAGQVPNEVQLRPNQTTETAANALQCAAEEGCTVVNLGINWGYGGHAIRPDRLSDKAKRLDKEGVLVIQPTGDSAPGQDSIDAPAYSPHVLAVGAADYTGKQAPFSPNGDILVQDEAGRRIIRKPDCLSYGLGVCSSQYDSDSNYQDPAKDSARQSGTQTAAAHVAAAAALLRQRARELHRTLTPEETRKIIREEGAVPEQNPYGARLADAQAWLRHLEPADNARMDREP